MLILYYNVSWIPSSIPRYLPSLVLFFHQVTPITYGVLQSPLLCLVESTFLVLLFSKNTSLILLLTYLENTNEYFTNYTISTNTTENLRLLNTPVQKQFFLPHLRPFFQHSSLPNPRLFTILSFTSYYFSSIPWNFYLYMRCPIPSCKPSKPHTFWNWQDDWGCRASA